MDMIKEAFSKIKEDINSIKKEVSNLRTQIEDIKTSQTDNTLQTLQQTDKQALPHTLKYNTFAVTE